MSERKDFLERIMTSTDLGYANAGLLTPEQGEVLAQGLPVVKDTIHIFREFKPTRYWIEYTIIYRSTNPDSQGGTKFRVDFALDGEDIELIAGPHAEGEKLENSVAAYARLQLKQSLRDNHVSWYS